MTTLIEIPLNTGINEGVEAKLLPDGVLRIVENCFLRRDGQLEVRPGDTALDDDTFAGRDLVAFDAINFNERLFVAGADNAQGYPADLFEYVAASETWKGVDPDPNNVHLDRLPFATAVRDLGMAPDGDGAVLRCTAAAHDGVVVMAYKSGDDDAHRVHAFKALSDSTLIYQGIAQVNNGSGSHSKVIVTTSGAFWILCVQDGDELTGYAYDPSADETIDTTGAVLDDAGQAVTFFDAAPVTGTGGGFVTAVGSGSGSPTIRLRRFSDAGTQLLSIDATAAAVGAIAVQCDADDNRLSVLYYVGGGTEHYYLETYDATTGVLVDGPTEAFAGGDPGTLDPQCSLVKHSTIANAVVAAGTIEDSGVAVTEIWTYDADDHGTTPEDERLWNDALHQAAIAHHGGEPLLAWTHPTGNAGNYLVSPRRQMPLVAKDFELSERVGSGCLGTLTRDAVTGKWYWANLFLNNDLTASAQVTELELLSTARRQQVSLGGLLYIAGGCPLVFDGRMPVEQGFQERPRVTTALASSNGAGALASGGTYSYVFTWAWTDCQRNVHRSPPSAISEVTLGASDDTVTGRVSTPHSLRCNDQARLVYGSRVRLEVWRTPCTVVEEAATVLTIPCDPPVTSLDGLTFAIAVDRGAFQAFTFGASDDDPTSIAATINGNTTGLTATVEGGCVRITSDTVGDDSVLQFGGTPAALDALGINIFPAEYTGSRTVTRGANFHRATSVVINTEFGAPRSFTDTTSDDELRTREVLYTQSQTPIPHHAPPPHEYVWPAGDALLIAGLPRRSEAARSKRLFFAEPIAFADSGRLAFNFRGNGDLTAAVALDQANLLFTRSALQRVSGEGPDHSGTGEFFAPDDVPVDGGVADWRSLILTSDGLFFALDDAPSPKIYLAQQGAAQWVSFPVQDLLDAYPVVVGAAHVRQQQHVVFACNTANGSGGLLLRYDLRRKVWYTHTVSGALRSVSSYRGRLVYVLSTGAVMLADASVGAGTFVSYRIRTGSFAGFSSLGYGSVCRVGLLGTLRGACSIEGRISYDDALSFSTMDSYALTGTAGTPVVKLWTPKQDRTDRFVLEFLVTGTSDSAGVWLHKLLLEVERAPGPTRRGPADLK